MSIKVNIPPIIQGDLTKDWAIAEVSGTTVGRCLKYLVKKLPYIEKELFAKSGKLHGFIFLRVNELSLTRELNKPVKNGDEIRIIRFVSG
ncbi:MoaD/ThiS family protein [Chloroflexota bacterium]